ncbi:unnamed protein product [Schistosoma rodhaini]|uniref:Uncharacterized protein n=1 Tax=Schistosoma rodhaini TaxID=6188 RepID=A0AA85EJQ3_9TREM|nr:unnamed protein product [Schistosoma rodhaini]
MVKLRFFGITSMYYKSNTSDHYNEVAMEPVMERLDIHSDFDAFEDYMKWFEIWTVTKEDVEDANVVAHFPAFIGKEAYSLINTLTFSGKPISLPYAALKKLLLDYVKYTSFERVKGGKFHKMIHQGIKNSTTLLRHPNTMRTQGYADNSLRSCDDGRENGHKFGQFLSRGKFHQF